MRRRWAVGLLIGAVAAVAGCGRVGPGIVAENVPPDTEITLVAARGDSTGLRVHVAWIGQDADGEVTHFWTRLDSLGWLRTTRAESVVVLPPVEDADTLAALSQHVFAVKAVDNRGAEDETPALVCLDGRNLLPETEIVDGPSGFTCPMVHFEWAGWDYDGIVTGYGYRLWAWYGDISDWVEVAGDDSLGAEEFSIDFGPLNGQHRFEVWSIDDEGGVDPTPATSTFTCSDVLVGPTLYVSSNVFTSFVFRGFAWPPSSDVPIAIFEGQGLEFRWLASAYPCADEIVGYSSAYDDTSDWCSSFSLLDTGFEVTPEVGVHALYVAVKDDTDEITRGKISLEVVETTLDQYVLIVDDYDFRETQEQWGTDEQRDAFYDSLTAQCARPSLEWDVLAHVFEPPDVATLASASTVLWYQDGEGNLALLDLFDDPVYDRLGSYVRVGGNLVLCGFEGLRQILSEPYPMAITAGDTTVAQTFVRDVLGIGYADNSGAAANKDAPWTYGYCFYGAVPGATWVPEWGRFDLEPMYVDSVGPGGYPEPGKWPVYTLQNPPGYVRAGLCNVEKLNAYQGGPIESHTIDAYLNMNFEGEPCIVVSPTGSDRGNVAYFGFPLYYIQTDQAKAAFDKLLEIFGEAAAP